MNILEIEILTSNFDETEYFYTKVLGLKTINKTQDIISLVAGKSTLTFRYSDRTSSTYHFAFNIPNNKLDEALIWLSKKAELIKNEEGTFITNFDSWNAKSLYFYDNNGNVLEFITRFDLNQISDQPFTSGSISAISEIGVVTDTPIAFAERMINEHELQYFAKGPKREDFAVLGDDNGLIIISSSNRDWYPTHHRAEKHPVKMKIDVGTVITEIFG